MTGQATMTGASPVTRERPMTIENPTTGENPMTLSIVTRRADVRRRSGGSPTYLATPHIYIYIYTLYILPVHIYNMGRCQIGWRATGAAADISSTSDN